MGITDKINEDIKTAMRAKDREKLDALRDIKSKLLLEMTKDGSDEVDEATGMRILNKLHKQRIDAATIYKEQNRDDLYQEEMSQAAVIEEYLPAKLSEEEVKTHVSALIERVGANSMADMGKVMGMASKELAGKADGKMISEIVKGLLN